ncbi:NlpE N-terminal domain-containing protein [Bacteroides faecichinchillae]|uniref:NlpE N-terminal domain-containing protein n=1 Tax=Bacteroides faecichinchillae TaxID=871325 RepID=A0A1M5CQ60_9BACE|nr:copper resistance protein NlpE [Bacteroides faecichinchillae]THG65746.1 copper resistance protein NlpE [Bacteroides faecichinchillae]SHF56851.1 NlpE N-terminal domain-containing protein [Bacteroides faecichinchillae]
MTKILILTCSCMLLVACGNGSKANKGTRIDSTSTKIIDTHNAEISLDYEGTYKGVFPAADCPGIEITLILNKDKTFTLHSVYIDRDSSFDEKGTYTLKDNILTLKEEGGEESYYKVGKNHLSKLMADKKEVTGKLAEHYILNKE